MLNLGLKTRNWSMPEWDGEVHYAVHWLIFNKLLSAVDKDLLIRFGGQKVSDEGFCDYETCT